MKMIRTIGAFLFAAIAVSAEIASLADLNKAFDDGTQTIGFLTRTNYDSVQELLPKEVAKGGKLVVKLYETLDLLEDAVVAGKVIAGLTTYTPADAKGKLTLFGTGKITPQSAYFKPGDGDAMQKAFDAAVVRLVNSGEAKRIKNKYLANGWNILQVDTCSTKEDNFPFPKLAGLGASDVLKGVINKGVLRVGGFEADWGFQGNYEKKPPSGFWPEYETAIYKEISDQYLTGGAQLTVQRVWNGSKATLDNVLAGNADMTAPYWFIPGTYKGTARHYHLDAGCATIGGEQQFFTLRPKSSPVDETDIPPGVIAGAAISGVVAVMAIMLICIMIKKEKKGQPLFTPLE